MLIVVGVLLTDEEFWQEQRRFVVRHLKEFGFGRRTMADLVEEEAGQMVQAIQRRLEGSQVGRTVTLLPYVIIHPLHYHRKRIMCLFWMWYSSCERDSCMVGSDEKCGKVEADK